MVGNDYPNNDTALNAAPVTPFLRCPSKCGLWFAYVAFFGVAGRGFSPENKKPASQPVSLLTPRRPSDQFTGGASPSLSQAYCPPHPPLHRGFCRPVYHDYYAPEMFNFE